MKIKAKDYKTREEIELVCKDSGTEIEIEGTRDELSKLGLSKSTKVYGAKCIETDSIEDSKVQEVPSRGEIYKSGINLEK